MFAEVIEEEVGVCLSGGLSSLTVAAWLAASGVRTTAFVADIGQAPPGQVNLLASALEAAGIRATVVDLTAEMAEMAMDLVRYQARYDGGYWNTTGASRLVLVRGLATAMRAAGCTMLAHGCVGGGNDQRRFERYAAALAPDLRVLSPWLEPELQQVFADRSAMHEYVQRLGLPCGDLGTASYSVDGNMAGFSHEGTELEDLRTPDTAVRAVQTVLPSAAPDKPETVRVRFDRGHPTAIGEENLGPRQLLAEANAIAGRNGAGLRSVVEDRINGTKCRGTYEAPGLDLLGFCADRVFQVTVDKDARRFLGSLAERIGRGVYEGRYLDQEIRAACAAADVLIAVASATVEVELYKGGMSLRGITQDANSPLPARQTRFSHGGHFWRVAV